MADNVQITAGSGTTIATDDVSGTHYQEIKIVDGTKDATTPLKVATEGVAFASSVTGLVPLAVRRDAGGPGAGVADGDYSTLSVDQNGFLYVMAFIDSGFVNTSGSDLEDEPVTGVLTMAGKSNDGYPGSVTTDGDVVAFWARPNGAQVTTDMPVSTATLTSVNDSASSVSLVAANDDRVHLIIHNESSSFLYIKYGTTASLTSYTYRIDPYGTWEMGKIYSGAIDGIWSADSSGAARITEL